MANGNGVHVQFPIWVKALAQIGAPAFFALLFAAVLLGIIPSRLTVIEETIKRNNIMLRVICYRLATETKQAQECDWWRERE